MAEALTKTGSFDIKSIFVKRSYVGVFYGWEVAPQINQHYFNSTSPHWYSIHSFGLPMLAAPFLIMAPFFHLSPLNSLIAGMSLWGALAIVAVWLYCYEVTENVVGSSLAALSLLGSLSFLSLTGDLFPDLPSATLLAISLFCIAKLKKTDRWYWFSIASACSSFLLYLHVKNGLTTFTLLGGLFFLWTRGARDKRSLSMILLPSFALITFYVIKIHQWYHTWVTTAPFGNGQLFHFVPGLAIIASLFDTTKGLLPNNPAYILLFLGLAAWWQHDRRSISLALLVLVPSLLLQSTFNDWAGGYSPIGRYMMPALLALWPAVAFAFSQLKNTASRVGAGLLLVLQLSLGVFYVVKKYPWNYAGDANPIFLSIQSHFHIHHDVGSAIFSYSLGLHRPLSVAILGLELIASVALFAIGLLKTRGAGATLAEP